jgi:hypothetical protein
MTRTSHAGKSSLLAGVSAALLGVLLLAGCGGSRSTATSTAVQPSVLGHDAIMAPPATELRPGMTVRVRRSTLHTVGWQVACRAKGRRVDAEAVLGQRTGSGQVAGFKGGSPSIWIAHNDDGSITASCH